MYFKIYIPAGVWGLLFVVLTIIIAHAGLSLFDHWGKKKNIPHNNEVAGIIFGVMNHPGEPLGIRTILTDYDIPVYTPFHVPGFKHIF